jgi:uncharacterized coiled-coil DUF342 family protein
MNNLDTHIRSVNEKLQQLVKKHIALKKENDNLRNELNNLKEREVEYKYAMHELDQKVSILKAGSGEMNEKDKKDFEKRIDQYIKEIDKCIGLLSD